jgi:acyl carrier protein
VIAAAVLAISGDLDEPGLLTQVVAKYESLGGPRCDEGGAGVVDPEPLGPGPLAFVKQVQIARQFRGRCRPHVTVARCREGLGRGERNRTPRATRHVIHATYSNVPVSAGNYAGLARVSSGVYYGTLTPLRVPTNIEVKSILNCRCLVQLVLGTIRKSIILIWLGFPAGEEIGMDIEAVVRDGLARVLDSDPEPASIDPELDLADDYGLTSLNKVIFLMSVCDETKVSLAEFTESDVAQMRTVRDVTTALSKFVGRADARSSADGAESVGAA